MVPENFKKRMRKLLGQEYGEFIKSLNDDIAQGLRVNTLKLPVEDFKKISPFKLLGNIPWEERGFYINEDKPGKHPYHSAGLYYIQEPSAMAVVSALNIKKGDKVLDLCAAPGGKSTQAAAYLQGSGILVSNEIDFKRAKILAENIERLGITNAVVLNNSPKELEKHFIGYFDKIIVDAPCSGEGMFKKEEEAALNWSEENVLGCALRQKEILQSADKMLKPGGYMIYSTCTFSIEENEKTIHEFLEEHKEYNVEKIEKKYGFSSGFGDIIGDIRLNDAARLFPHKLRGEGHFLCLLRKNDGVLSKNIIMKNTTKVQDLKLFYEFQNENLNINIDGNLFSFGGNLYKLPDDIFELNGLRVLRSGLHIGTFKNNWFEPSHSLALALKKEDAKRTLNISSTDESIISYLSGNILNVNLENGWCLICIDGYSLGWGKVSNGKLKNHYPKGLRWV